MTNPIDRAFGTWGIEREVSDADSLFFGLGDDWRSQLVSDDAVDMTLWARTHTIDIPAPTSNGDGLWGPSIHVGPANV